MHGYGYGYVVSVLVVSAATDVQPVGIRIIFWGSERAASQKAKNIIREKTG